MVGTKKTYSLMGSFHEHLKKKTCFATVGLDHSYKRCLHMGRAGKITMELLLDKAAPEALDDKSPGKPEACNVLKQHCTHTPGLALPLAMLRHRCAKQRHADSNTYCSRACGSSKPWLENTKRLFWGSASRPNGQLSRGSARIILDLRNSNKRPAWVVDGSCRRGYEEGRQWSYLFVNRQHKGCWKWMLLADGPLRSNSFGSGTVWVYVRF